MKTRAALIVAVLGTAASAFAQDTQGTITYTLDYQTYRPSAPGVWTSATLQPPNSALNGAFGDGALLRITMAMSGTPAIDGTGTPLTWAPSVFPGSSGSGTLAGFWAGDVNVVGDNNAASALGRWSDNSATFATAVRRTLLVFTTGNSSGGNGYVNGSYSGTIPGPGNANDPASRVTDIQPAQLADGDIANVNTNNNVIVWKGLWIPSSYATRTVNFNAVLGSLGFLSKVAAADNNGSSFPVPLSRTTSFGPAGGVNVGVIPTPSSLALIGLGGLVAARRRR